MPCPCSRQSPPSSTALYLKRFNRAHGGQLRDFQGLEEEMVGIFSRISGGWGSHRRGESEIDAGNTLSPNMEEGSSASAAVRHGLEPSVQFNPVQHPSEPLVHDQAVTCPLSEPSILNDGRIWKERRTPATAHATTDLPVVKDGSHCRSRDGRAKPPPANPADHPVPSSAGAPELTLREKCSTSDDQTS